MIRSNRTSVVWIVVLASALVTLCAAAPVVGQDAGAQDAGGGREIALVIDTSRSMRGNDPGRYTLQIAQMLGDLLAESDGLTVIRMAKKETGCDAGADPLLTRRLDPRDRISFERQLEPLLRFNTGTNFAAALRTAISVLDRVPERRRLLLVIADPGGLGRCAKVLDPELLALRARGVELAAIHLGDRAGAFDGHPAFAATRTAADSEELMATVATIYQRFLGVRRVQTGRVEGGRIRVTVDARTQVAHLVVAADGEVGRVRPAADVPGARSIDPNVHGGGQAVGVDKRRRTYRIVRLERPGAGEWTFVLPELAVPELSAGWMLIQESALGLRRVVGEPWVAGRDARLEVELVDLDTGERVGRSAAPTATIEAELDGRPVRLRDDGTGGDRIAGDGVYTTTLVPRLGQVIDLRLGTERLDTAFTIRPEVLDRPPEPPPSPPSEPVDTSGCWWTLLVAGAVLALVGVLVHGVVSPARFPPRAGLQISPDEALADGFFHPFRGQRGARSGFYRDARLYLHPDFRLTASAAGALARVRASAGGLRLLPLGPIERRVADGSWEPLAEVETRLRPGVAYRDTSANLYFEARQG